MGSAGNFEEQDRCAAQNFAAAAKAAGVERIIYLGGLGEDAADLSPHLRSRHEVGEVLRLTGVPVIEFRASIIIGSGSLSFEMIRALVERLPIMVTPRWVRVLAQPIAINDMLAYLLAALELPNMGSATFDVGGPDAVSYADLMREYARERGLRRWMIPVPVLTPRLSSLWLGLVTPLYARVGRKLIDSIQHPTVVRDESARRAFPVEPVGMTEAIARALRNEEHDCAANPVVGRGVGQRHGSDVGWYALWEPFGGRARAAGAGEARTGVCRSLSHWRGDRLVLCQLVVDVAGVDGLDSGRRWHAARAA